MNLPNIITQHSRQDRLIAFGQCIDHGDGPEFSSEPFKDWLTKVGIKPIRIYPNSPWENGYNERFNETLR